MAHLITNEKDFAYAKGIRPWHGLGTETPGLMTVREALVAANLDFEVEKRQAHFLNREGILVPAEDCYVTVRTDTEHALGHVGPGYHPVQNAEALSFFDPAIGEGAAAIETAGSLKGGSTVFLQAALPDAFEAVPGDPLERKILFSTSHDGSSGVRALFTAIQVVCWNTFSAAIAGARNVVSIRHTRGAAQAIRQAHEVLHAEKAYWDRAKRVIRWMTLKDLNRDAVKSTIEKLFPGSQNPETGEIEVSTRTENARDAVLASFLGKGKGADVRGYTAWGLLSAVTDYQSNERPVRATTNRWAAVTLGGGNDLAQSAMDLLTADIPAAALQA